MVNTVEISDNSAQKIARYLGEEMKRPEPLIDINELSLKIKTSKSQIYKWHDKKYQFPRYGRNYLLSEAQEWLRKYYAHR
jgi:predicted DNA-binding transcriptional regulator AlpA